MTLFTTAYAGSGKLDEKLVADHLNNLLPAELGFVFIPDGEIPPRRLVGLHRVVTWLESEVGKEGTIPVKDLITALVARRDGGVAFDGADHYEGGDDVALVMVYDPENPGDVMLAKAAHEQGIRVVDLTHAADDIVFEDEPEPPADEEVADEQPPWEEDEPTPAEAAAAAAEAELGVADERLEAAARAAERAPSPAASIAKAAADGMAAAAAAKPVTLPGVAIQFTVNLDQDAINAIADAIVAAMGRQAQSVIESVPTPPLTLVPTEGQAGRATGTKAYYHNIDAGTYRPARGVAKQGEVKVNLDAAQEAEARSNGMLK